jgi:RimJ/RimL family protein N-acetyltransferase
MPGAVFAEGDSVTLRTIEEGDLDFLQRWRNHPEVRTPLTDSDPRNAEQMRDYFDNRISGDGDGFGFVVCVEGPSESTEEASGEAASSVAEQRESTGEASGDEGPASNANDRDAAAERVDEQYDPDEPVPVGAVHMPWIRQPHGSGMLMYWVAPPHQGNGYVTEATELLLDFAFEERRIAKARAVVLDSNEGSVHVLESLGFQHEGTQREEVFVDGERRDMHRYGLLAEEWLDASDA